jgi:hypothetical protein
MLDDLNHLLDDKKRSDLLGRLNNKRVEQALPAEMELALTWAMIDFDSMEIEPEWCVKGKKPDVYVEGLVPGRAAIVEIASTNDNSISGEKLMDRCSQQIINYANTIRKGFGDYLYFNFSETREYKRKQNIRGIAAPKDYILTDLAKLSIKEWITSIQPNNSPISHLRIEDSGLCVNIEKKNYKQTRYHNFWTSRPPRVYSETNNPIYNILDEKLLQIEAAPAEIYKIIFLAEIGSRTLDELAANHLYSVENNATAEKIIHRFLIAKNHRLNAVVVFLPKINRNFFHHVSDKYWKAIIFSCADNTQLLEGINKISKKLPLPRFTGSQARSLFRQGAFHPKARGWYIGTNMRSSKDEIIYGISSRALQDFLARRITEEQFRDFIGERKDGPSVAQFLNNGMMISEISFEKGGVDEDDDRVIFKFTKDPAAHHFE